MKVLFVLFVVLPVTELMVLIEVGSMIGLWKTVACVLITAFIGATLLRRQGLDTLVRANQRLENGQVPAKEVFEGFLLALGGAFLLTPGFITDAFGFFILVPQSRSFLASHFLKQFSQSGGFRVYGGFGNSAGENPFGQRQTGPFSHSNHHAQQESRDDIIEGEFVEINEEHQLPDKKEKKN